MTFRSDSYRNPNGVRKDSGYGYGYGSLRGGGQGGGGRRTAEYLAAERRTAERHCRGVVWAREHLPELCPELENLAACAVGFLATHKRRREPGYRPSAQAVREQMAAMWPRLADEIRAKGKTP